MVTEQVYFRRFQLVMVHCVYFGIILGPEILMHILTNSFLLCADTAPCDSVASRKYIPFQCGGLRTVK